MKIANKISLSFFVAALIIMSTASSIFYIISRNNLRHAIYNNLVTAVCFRTDHIRTYLKMLETSVRDFSNSAVLENLLKLKGKESPQQNDAFEAARKRLTRTEEDNPAIAEFLLLDKAGKVVASSNRSSVGLDMSRDTFFIHGRKETYIKDVYYSEKFKEPLLVVSSPFFDSQTDELLGVLAAQVRLIELYNITTPEVGLGQTGEIYIVNENGYMITPSRFKEDIVLKQRVDTKNVRLSRLHKDIGHASFNVDTEIATGIFPNYRGVEVLGVHEYISELGWSVLAEIDAQEAFEPLVKLRLAFLTILFIVPLAAWLLGWGIARVIIGPLDRLSKGMKIIGSGNLDYQVATDAKDEVGQLSRTVDTMTKDLKKTTISIEGLSKEVAVRKKVEEELRETNEYLENLFSYANAPIIVWNPQFKIIHFNHAFELLTGRSEKDIAGKTIDIFFPVDEAEDSMRVIKKTVAGQRWETVDINILHLDGSVRTVLWNSANILSADKKAVVATIAQGQDITERKKAEEKLNLALKEEMKSREIVTSMLEDNNQVREKLEQNIEELKTSYSKLKDVQAQVVQSAKLASLGQMAGGVAHEINNPLTGVLNNVQLIKMVAGNKESFDIKEFKELLDIVEESAIRCRQITQSLLDFSHASTGLSQPLSLNEVTEKVAILVAHELKLQNILIQKDLQPDLPLILGDSQLLQQVIFNFISNAKWAIQKKSAKEGGTITIRTQYEALKKEVHIFVSDSGVGISEDNLKKIFESFFSTKEVGEGTGLGLSLAQDIVHKHGGRIEVESRLGEGATFKVSFPVISEVK